MSIGRDWYWPSTMPSYGGLPFSVSVCSMPGTVSATPRAWAMSAVSCILLRRSSCRRRKDVLSDFFVASAIEQVPHVLPSAFSTICEPGSWYGAEEY